MTIKDFEKLSKNRFQHCEKVLNSKNKEYSRGEDKLHNFKVAGRMGDITPEFALVGMFMKHLVSIFDIVNDLDECKLPSEEILAEKLTDTINYLVLLEGLISERLQNDVG
jgi:hypothetical protein